MVKRFILSDQSIPNHYGFYVDHSTLDLERFKDNAPLLYMHVRGEVHGKWVDLEFDGPQLLATPEFDMPDPESEKIAGKVERGILKAASLYLGVTNKTLFVEDEEGKVWMKYAEVWEASIVDIPANKKSLVKLSLDGKEMSSQEIEAFKLSALEGASIESKTKINKQIENRNMSKIMLSAVTVATLMAYGLKDGESASEVDSAVAKLKAELDAESAAHKLEKDARLALEAKVKAQEAAELTALIDQAVTDGQILAAQKETFVALGLEQAKSIISGLPKKVTLAGQVGNAGYGASAADPKTIDEFEKLSDSDKLAFKDGNPEGYMALFAK